MLLRTVTLAERLALGAAAASLEAAQRQMQELLAELGLRPDRLYQLTPEGIEEVQVPENGQGQVVRD